MCCWSLRAPTPLQAILWPIIDPILVTFGQICNFRDPNLFTLYLCIYLILNEEHNTFQLQYKHSGTLAYRKYEELSNPKNQKVWDPILVTLLKMWLHYSQPSCENATLSSGTSHQPLIRKYLLREQTWQLCTCTSTFAFILCIFQAGFFLHILKSFLRSPAVVQIFIKSAKIKSGSMCFLFKSFK